MASYSVTKSQIESGTGKRAKKTDRWSFIASLLSTTITALATFPINQKWTSCFDQKMSNKRRYFMIPRKGFSVFLRTLHLFLFDLAPFQTPHIVSIDVNTHLLARSLPHSPTHPLTHSLYLLTSQSSTLAQALLANSCILDRTVCAMQFSSVSWRMST